MDTIKSGSHTPSAMAILSGASVAFAAQVIGYLIQFFSQRVILSELSKEENGVISYVLTICTAVFGFMVEAGLTSIAIRDIARNPERKMEYLRALFTLRIVSSVLAVGVVCAIAYFSYRDYVLAMFFAAMMMMIAGRTPMLRAVFEIEHRAQTRLTVVSVMAVLDIVCFFLLLSLPHTHLTPQRIFAYQFVACIPGFAFLILLRKAYRYIHFSTDTALLKEMLSEAKPLVLLTLLLYSHIAIDTFALRTFAPPESLGIFGAASNAAMLGTVIFSVSNSLYAPYLSRSYYHDAQQAQIHVIRSLYGVAFMLILTAALCAVLTPFIIEIFTKNKYADNAFEFQAQFWSSVVMNLLQFGVVIITAIGKQERQVRIGLALIVGSLLADYYFMSNFQAAGMIYAKTVSNGLAFVVFLISMRDVLQDKTVVLFVLRFLSLFALAFTSVQLSAGYTLPLAFLLVLLAVCAGAAGLGFISQYERDILRKFIRR